MLVFAHDIWRREVKGVFKSLLLLLNFLIRHCGLPTTYVFYKEKAGVKLP